MADQGQKTEQPTPRRLQKAREEGQFPLSRELFVGTQMLIAVYALTSFGGALIDGGKGLVRAVFTGAFSIAITPVQVISSSRGFLGKLLWPCAYGLLAITVAPLVVQVLSTQLGISARRLRPDWSRLNPGTRIQGMISQNGTAALISCAALVGASLLIATTVLARTDLLLLALGSLPTGLARAGSELSRMLWKGAAGLFLIGLIDYLFQRSRWQKRLRMSKQEIRDEHKESEGSPEMKMRLRRIQRDLLRRQMMREVPKATAVITNPTHFAVAIRYESDSMTAPTVIAKGKNFLALRIRQKAKDCDIPIVENPPLAQALYKSVDVGQEIPPHLYRAVAEIIAYIFRLMHSRRS